MKICKRCGAIQSNEHNHCIDCGERLGAPLTIQEEKEIEHKVTDKITKLSNKRDYFYVTKLDKAIAISLIIGIIISLAIRIFGVGFLTREDLIITTLIIPFMAVGAVDLRFPWISWELFKLRYIFIVANTDDMQPSDLALYIRRIFPYLITLVWLIYIIYIITELL